MPNTRRERERKEQNGNPLRSCAVHCLYSFLFLVVCLADLVFCPLRSDCTRAPFCSAFVFQSAFYFIYMHVYV